MCEGPSVAVADKDILYAVAYEEAVRALSEQQGVIDSFRSRAGLLLSAAAITTSFLGSQALDGENTHWTAWLAMAAFAGVAAGSLVVYFQIAGSLLAIEVVIWIMAIASGP